MMKSNIGIVIVVVFDILAVVLAQATCGPLCPPELELKADKVISAGSCGCNPERPVDTSSTSSCNCGGGWEQTCGDLNDESLSLTDVDSACEEFQHPRRRRLCCRGNPNFICGDGGGEMEDPQRQLFQDTSCQSISDMLSLLDHNATMEQTEAFYQDELELLKFDIDWASLCGCRNGGNNNMGGMNQGMPGGGMSNNNNMGGAGMGNNINQGMGISTANNNMGVGGNNQGTTNNMGGNQGSPNSTQSMICPVCGGDATLEIQDNYITLNAPDDYALADECNFPPYLTCPQAIAIAKSINNADSCDGWLLPINASCCTGVTTNYEPSYAGDCGHTSEAAIEHTGHTGEAAIEHTGHTGEAAIEHTVYEYDVTTTDPTPAPTTAPTREPTASGAMPFFGTSVAVLVMSLLVVLV